MLVEITQKPEPMTSIIVADGDESVLHKLQHDLDVIHPDWNVVACTRGDDVLMRAAAQYTDCVISTLKLQDMSSLELFQSMHESSPDIIRILLTADLEHQSALDYSGANHRIVDQSAPVCLQAETIESSIRLNRILRTDAIRQQIGNIGCLPSIPDIYQQMVRELSNPLSTLHSVARIIETDAALMASVLKIVNSALFARCQKIESLTQAVSLLGISFIKNVALTTELFNQFKGNDVDLNRLLMLNNHANRTGVLSNHFARLARLPRQTVDHIQLAGMLSNVGDLLALCQRDCITKTSHEFYGGNEMLGACLLRIWILPDPVVEAVAFQYERLDTKIPSLTPLSVLQAIRYLEATYTDPGNSNQHAKCLEYIQRFAGKQIAGYWTDAYNDLLLLDAPTHLGNSKAA